MNTKKLAIAAAVLAAVKGTYNPRFIKLDAAKSLGYGRDNVFELSQAATYQGIEFVTDLPMARIERITIEYQDGSEFYTVVPALLKARDEYLGKKVFDAADAGTSKTRVYLDFADDDLRTTDGIRRGEMVVLPGEVVRIKVRLASRVVDAQTPENSDPETPILYANANETAAQADRYFVPRISQMIVSHTVAGEQKHKFPLMGMNHRIRRMWLQTNKLTDFELYRDRVKIMFGNVEDMQAQVERHYGRKVPAGWVCIDFIAHGFASESAFVPVANESLQLGLTLTAAQEIPVYFEYITQNKEIPVPQDA